MNRMPPKESADKVLNTLLVDGNSLLKTAYHGAKDLYNSRGVHIGGIYQFITILRKLMDDQYYHRVFVFWDGKLSGKMRYEYYPMYKGDRGKNFETGSIPEEEFMIQAITVKQYLEELFIRQLEDPIVEADDFIAFFCKTKKSYEKITIVSSDKDLSQLINEDVRQYFLNRKRYITDYNFKETFGYDHRNVKVLKILTGDSSDCIKGIKGLGEGNVLKYFPQIIDTEIDVKFVIKEAKNILETRKINKQKPLKVLENIVHSVTDGVQGKDIYEINEKIINLKMPLITDQAIKNLEILKNSSIDPEGRGIKNIINLFQRDGILEIVQNYVDDYLQPFKRNIEREKKFN